MKVAYLATFLLASAMSASASPSSFLPNGVHESRTPLVCGGHGTLDPKFGLQCICEEGYFATRVGSDPTCLKVVPVGLGCEDQPKPDCRGSGMPELMCCPRPPRGDLWRCVATQDRDLPRYRDCRDSTKPVDPSDSGGDEPSGDPVLCKRKKRSAARCMSRNGYVDTMYDCKKDCKEQLASNDRDCEGQCAIQSSCLRKCAPLCVNQITAASNCGRRQKSPHGCVCKAFAADGATAGKWLQGAGKTKVHHQGGAVWAEDAKSDSEDYDDATDSADFESTDFEDDAGTTDPAEFDSALNLAHDLKTKKNLRDQGSLDDAEIRD